MDSREHRFSSQGFVSIERHGETQMHTNILGVSSLIQYVVG